MGSIIWLLVFLMLAGIVASLGSALFHLSRGRGERTRASWRARSRVRVGLSLALFVLLMVAWRSG